jgi:hypothetical protein
VTGEHSFPQAFAAEATGFQNADLPYETPSEEATTPEDKNATGVSEKRIWALAATLVSPAPQEATNLHRVNRRGQILKRESTERQ